MLLNCCFGEDSWESFGLQGDQTSQSQRKSILNIYWKDWCWTWNSNTLATWCEKLTHLKKPWCWERLRAGEGDDRGWDGWMASPTQQTWVWAVSECWWTGKPGVLQSMGLQRVRHEWATELNYAFNFSLAFSNVSFNKAILETKSFGVFCITIKISILFCLLGLGILAFKCNLMDDLV